ncbi:MAG: Ribonuclease toxin, BrnT, of type toxin-antitoxin system [Gemmatimonadetes bacterium]|nr:Ribonuclease toxin, BrnT, of type toxin-antitoxin system [Gemmatimonadota bacterium]
MYIHVIRLMTPPTGFQWDPAQCDRCSETFGFTFAEVADVFEDEEFDYLRIGPMDHDGEMRYRAIGRMSWGLIVVVAYTMRGTDRRIIWARPARKDERRAFEDHNRGGAR